MANSQRNITAQPATRIRSAFVACRIKFKWFGTTKTLSSEQKSLAAQSFGANGQAISAGKRLIDTKHKAYKGITSIKSQITRFWKDNSLPFPEPGIRLIKIDRIDEFDDTFRKFQSQLTEAVDELDQHYSEIKAASRENLGGLFNEGDYPASLADEFDVAWEFPSVEPPNYLQELNPQLYEEQCRRVSQRFERSVELAEQMFIEQLDRLVNHLSERLAGDEDGRPKVFRDSAVDNMTEFFSRFRDLNLHSNEQLDELVNRCERMVNGVSPQSLRDNDSLRRHISTQLATVQSSLDQMLVDRPAP